MTANIREKDSRHVLQTYGRAPFVLDRGVGMHVWDTDGKEYLDFTSGIAVTPFGHADPEIAAAVSDQMMRLGHVSNLYHTAPQAELADMLCAHSFADRVFFCNSGTEAIEGAIKFARKYARTVTDRPKTQIVSFSGAFHGRSVGALSLTPREAYQAPFRPLMSGVAHVPFNDVAAAQEAIGPETCAVFVEPVQGEGGVNPATPEFLQALRALCNQHGALLVFDEIQTGMGRTGTLWGYQGCGVQPDIMTLAKALGGGLPIGAVLMTERVAAAMQPGDHGSTFAGGPVVCRAAQVVLHRAAAPETLAHVAEMGTLLMERLSEINSPHIREVRGRGLMIGVELDIPAGPVLAAGYAQGMLLLNAGPNVLRLLPPYIIREDHIDTLVNGLTSILREQ
ncbi:MAG: aspartate aminotransferase family protein [Anaerolineae bacterium]|nr:aspartate aminotransferase family protein [Anaerolineae bacterium]